MRQILLMEKMHLLCFGTFQHFTKIISTLRHFQVFMKKMKYATGQKQKQKNMQLEWNEMETVV